MQTNTSISNLVCFEWFARFSFHIVCFLFDCKGYEDRVRLADLTFRHQRIWDVENNCLATLTPMPLLLDSSAPENDYIGPVLSPEQAYGVASGYLNPHTKLPPEAVAPTPTAQQPQVFMSSLLFAFCRYLLSHVPNLYIYRLLSLFSEGSF
jgi:hypothetical protein